MPDSELTEPVSPELSPQEKQFAEEWEEIQTLELKNPLTAGILTWLVPGWGHYYQGRTVKAVLFFLCIVPTFIIGCVLGSSSEAGIARNVYYSWRFQDKRLFFIPQACLAMAAVPAGLQAMQLNNGGSPLFGTFMAPPQLTPDDSTGVPPLLDQITFDLSFLFELGTYLTVIAGLMNLLAIFDAVDGPVIPQPNNKKRKEQSEEQKAQDEPDTKKPD